MCCNTASGAKRVFSLLSQIDPAVGDGSSLLHRKIKGDAAFQNVDLLSASEAVDAAIRRAQSSAAFASVSDEERIRLYAAATSLREALADGLEVPAGTVAALTRYAEGSWLTRISKEKGTAGIGLFLVAGAAIGLPLSMAETSPTAKAPISITTAANASKIHAKPINGVCKASSFKLSKVKGKSYTTKLANGKRIKLKSGQLICVQVVKPVVTPSPASSPTPVKSYPPTFDSQGRAALPPSFPTEGKATVSDVLALGWTRDTVVGKSAILPEPIDAITVGVSPDRVILVSTEMRNGERYATWRVEGGAGLFSYGDGVGLKFEELGGSKTFITSLPEEFGSNRSPIVCWADKGQSNLPAKSFANWSNAKIPCPVYTRSNS
jgi:hypothetical protein